MSYHPALLLAMMGMISGVLGTFGPGMGFGNAPDVGIYMVLTGLWFGAVIGFGLRWWGGTSWAGAMVALVATWVGWEFAVNLALHLTENWLKYTAVPEHFRMHAGGFAAGAAGAFLTWLGAAATSVALRSAAVAISVVTTGALFGLLLGVTNQFDNPGILLVPWQCAVAAAFGSALARQSAQRSAAIGTSPSGA